MLAAPDAGGFAVDGGLLGVGAWGACGVRGADVGVVAVDGVTD